MLTKPCSALLLHNRRREENRYRYSPLPVGWRLSSRAISREYSWCQWNLEPVVDTTSLPRNTGESCSCIRVASQERLIEINSIAELLLNHCSVLRPLRDMDIATKKPFPPPQTKPCSNVDRLPPLKASGAKSAMSDILST